MNLRKEQDYVVFDLEIKEKIEDLPNGWEDKHLMGVSSAVSWDNLLGRFCVYDDHNMDQLVARLSSAPLVVGFNHMRFDYPVLGEAVKYPDRPVISNGDIFKTDAWPELQYGDKVDFDILLAVWKGLGKSPTFDKTTHMGYGLDSIAMRTLGLVEAKTGHGAHAPELYQEGRWAELIDYNMQDVRLTKDLFRFFQRYGYFVTKDGIVQYGQ